MAISAPGVASVCLALAPQPALAHCTPSNPCTGAPGNIGTPAGAFLSEAFGISGDGAVVIGEAFTTSGLIAFRWTGSGGMQDLGNLGGFASIAYAASSDGSVIVGESQIGCGCFHAFRWTAAGGMEDLGTLAGGSDSTALGVSGDGLVVVGVSDTAAGDPHAFRWTSAGGMVDLSTLGGAYSTAFGTNRDGSVVVGESSITGDSEIHAFRWTLAGGMVDLGTLGGPNSSAYATNSDGSVVVGEAEVSGGASHAFRWTSSGGMQDLGTLGGANSAARAVSADGSIVVGESQFGCGCTTHAFRWTALTGMQDLNTLLANAGVNMTGIVLETANGISADGRFIVGRGDFSGDLQAYIVRYDDGIAGVTTRGSAQRSINELSAARAGAMAQQHGLAQPLLGGDKPMGSGNEVGVYASAGSAAAGGFMRYGTGFGWALLGGIAFATENYPDAELKHGGTGALALQYLHGGGDVRPFAEAGGWIAPNARLSFSRTYANGASVARGTGETNGDLNYVYVRAGALLALGRADQLAISGELGRERMAVDGYVEPLSPQNPFEAHVAGGDDRMDMAKLRLAWSHRLAADIDGTLWAAGVRAFNRSSELTAFVPGIGVLAPSDLGPLTWAEYGVRIGYSLTDTVTIDTFANGVSGHAVDTRVHAGFALRLRY